MNRREFLKGMAGILATGIAPAVVGSGVLMPVRGLIADPWADLSWAKLLDVMDWAEAEMLRATGMPLMEGKSWFIANNAIVRVQRCLIEEVSKPVPKGIIYVPPWE